MTFILLILSFLFISVKQSYASQALTVASDPTIVYSQSDTTQTTTTGTIAFLSSNSQQNVYVYSIDIPINETIDTTKSTTVEIGFSILMQKIKIQAVNSIAPAYFESSESKYKLVLIDEDINVIQDTIINPNSGNLSRPMYYMANLKLKFQVLPGNGTANSLILGLTSNPTTNPYGIFYLRDNRADGENVLSLLFMNLDQSEDSIDYTNQISNLQSKLDNIRNDIITIATNQQTVSDNITDQLIANQMSTNTAINNQTNTIVNSITSLNGVVTNLPANINLYIATQTSSINARMDSNTDEIVTALGNIQINTTSLEDKITNLQTSLVNALQQQTQTLSGTNTQSEETDFLTQKDQFTSSINSFQYSQNSQLGSNLNSNINHITNELTSFAALIGTDVPHPSTTNRPGDFRKCRQGAYSNNTPAQFNVGSLRIPSTNTYIQIDLPCPRQFVARMFGISLTNSNVSNLYNMQSVGSWSNAYNLFKLSWAIFGFSYITIDLVKLFYKIIQPQKVITELNGL